MVPGTTQFRHNSHDTWQGVTYKEDKSGVMAALKGLKDDRLYPERLWR